MLYERVADFRGTPSHDSWAREGVNPAAFPLPTTYFAKSAVSERAVLGTRRRELTTEGVNIEGHIEVRAVFNLKSALCINNGSALRIPPSREGGPGELHGGHF